MKGERDREEITGIEGKDGDEVKERRKRGLHLFREGMNETRKEGKSDKLEKGGRNER